MMLMTAPDYDQLSEIDPAFSSKPFDARLLLLYFDEEQDDTAIGEILGVGRSTINKWRNEKSHMIGIYRADSLACRIGKHPALVWGNLWWRAEP